MTTQPSDSSEPLDAASLLHCPFCGSVAARGEVAEGENFGGQFIECCNAICGASTCLMFPAMDSVKEELAEKWNRRRALATPGQQAAEGRISDLEGQLRQSQALYAALQKQVEEMK